MQRKYPKIAFFSLFVLLLLALIEFSESLPKRGNRNSIFDNSTYNGPLDPQYKSYRKSKFFPLFTIIRFTNEVCKTTSEESGICYTRHQCTSLGGTSSGSCAQGLGICCSFQVGCSSMITQNGTKIQSPGYPNTFSPNTGTYICQIPIRKQNNVCQLKLNFIHFNIAPPVPGVPFGGTGGNTQPETGSCKLDTLAISSSGALVPPLCGTMSDQHLYVNYGSSDTITLNIMLSNMMYDRAWEIEVFFIPCNSMVLAPTGCLQYFQGISGEVKSFNFEGNTHLANMDYSSCIRMEDGMRTIEWTACGEGQVNIGGVQGQNTCPNDYLLIMGGMSSDGKPSQDRFCDPDFAGAKVVRSSVKPFLIHVKTNEKEETTNDGSKGFCLKWQQSAM